MPAVAGESKVAVTTSTAPTERLDYLYRALVAKQVEASWQTYLEIESYVPMAWRVQLAILLQRSKSLDDMNVKAERLKHLLLHWPDMTSISNATDEEISAYITGQRRCLDAYLVVEQRVDQVVHAVNKFLDRQEHGWRGWRVNLEGKGKAIAQARRPSMWTLNSLMRVYAQRGQPLYCRTWMVRMERAYQLKANSACWHWLVVAWLKQGQPMHAVGVVVREMPQAGLRVQARTWAALLREFTKRLSRSGFASGAAWTMDFYQYRLAANVLVRYLDRMYTRTQEHWYLPTTPGASAQFDAGQYGLNERIFAAATVLAQAIGYHASAQRFQECCNAINRRGTTESTILLRNQIMYWCRVGEYSMVRKLVDKLPVEKRYQPSIVNGLMTTARRAGRPDDAVAAFNEAAYSGLCRPNEYMWTTLIAAHAERMDLASACAAFEAMKAAGYTPTTISYTSLLVAYGKCGHLTGAEQVLRKMQQHHTPETAPNQKTWCALADAFAKTGDIESTISTLLNYHRLASGQDETSDTGNIFQTKSLDMISINTVMAALNRAGRPRDVLQLWRVAFDNGVCGGSAPLTRKHPDDTGLDLRSWNFATLCIVLDTCAWHNLPEEGEMVWREATEGLLELPKQSSDVDMTAFGGARPMELTSNLEMALEDGSDAQPDNPSHPVSTLPKRPVRERISRRCWYSYINLLGRTGRTREIPMTIEYMIGLGQIPPKSLLLHAFSFLIEVGDEKGVSRIGQLMTKLREMKRIQKELLPTEAEIAAYFRNRV